MPEGTSPAPEIWLIYSREHNAWWRPKAAGYTSHIENAGRYTYDEAISRAAVRDGGKPDPDRGVSEVVFLAPEAASAMADLVDALKFYARPEHWMSIGEDGPRTVLVAMADPPDADGFAVAKAALAKHDSAIAGAVGCLVPPYHGE